MFRLLRLWIFKSVCTFGLSAVILFILLLSGEGITRTIPFKGIYVGLFLLQFIPSSLLYILPIALLYMFAIRAYEVATQGSYIWFFYLPSLDYRWMIIRRYLLSIGFIIYAWLIFWGIPRAEFAVYRVYQTCSFHLLDRMKADKIHALNNQVFMSFDKNGSFFFNGLLPSGTDGIFCAKKWKKDKVNRLLQMSGCEFLLHHHDIAIHMKTESCVCDMDIGLTVAHEYKKSHKTLLELLEIADFNEVYRRIIIIFLGVCVAMSGWRQGLWCAQKRLSFVFVLILGLFWLLFLYIVFHGISIFF